MTASQAAVKCWLIAPAQPVPYERANEAMHRLAELRAAGEIPDVLVLLEHPPVYTAGRTSRDEHVVWSKERMLAMGAELHRIDRGGSLTFHGPGQLVGYPILQLSSRLDVVPHVRRMEEAVIRTAANFGAILHRSERQTGVWAGSQKVCAIGVRLSRERVTLHGFALNCTTDLSWFDGIVPCGLGDTGVTTLSALTDPSVAVSVGQVVPVFERNFQEIFERELGAAPADVSGLFESHQSSEDAAESVRAESV